MIALVRSYTYSYWADHKTISLFDTEQKAKEALAICRTELAKYKRAEKLLLEQEFTARDLLATVLQDTLKKYASKDSIFDYSSLNDSEITVDAWNFVSTENMLKSTIKHIYGENPVFTLDSEMNKEITENTYSAVCLPDIISYDLQELPLVK